jgi:hypothetical protein
MMCYASTCSGAILFTGCILQDLAIYYFSGQDLQEGDKSRAQVTMNAKVGVSHSL